MSLLSQDKGITKDALLARGFEEDGWGSLHMRQTHNTTMYEKVFQTKPNRDDPLGPWWQVNYFPPEFEGVVAPTRSYTFDMRGKVMAQRNADDEVFIIPVDSTLDLDLFIEAATRYKLTPFKLGKEPTYSHLINTKKHECSQRNH